MPQQAEAWAPYLTRRPASRRFRVLLSCRACLRSRDADFQALVDAGHGDVPLVSLRWRCSCCASTRIDAVVMSKDSAVVPW
jgi:hypothetical protein